MTVPMPTDTLSIALELLKAHPTWYLFPIQRLEKSPPCIPNNLVAASNDPAQIKQWHARYLGCNWGVALKKSGLIVPDVDTKPGKQGQQTLDILELEHGPMPETLIVRTPSGGLHYYYEEANGVTHQMRVSAFGKDVDSTNYVLAPGCWISDSAVQPYEIIADAPVAPAPAWFAEYLADRVVEQVEQVPAVDLDEAATIRRAIDYLRNDAKPSIQSKNGEFALLMTAAVLKDMGISEDTAIDLLNEYYNVPGKCEPQWSIGEGAFADRLDVKVKNAWTYLKNTQPGALSPQAEFGGESGALNEDSITKTMAVYLANPGLPKPSKPGDSVIKKAAREAMAEALRDPGVREPRRKPLPGELDVKDMQANALPLDPVKWADIDESRIPGSIEEVCKRWVWIVGIKRFVNRVDPTIQWDTKQFDSAFNQFVEKGSVSNELFKNGILMRKYRYVAFRPGSAETAGVEYNVWRPGPIKPVEGNTDLWNEHINYLFQDEDDRNNVLNWMAWVLQNPKLKPNHALLIVGKNTGTGKSLVATIFERLIGTRNTQRPKNSSMGGDFNSWLLNCRLCLIEEVYQVNRRENFNSMRDLITEKRVEVNIKGIPAFPIDNYVAMLGVSNHTDALPLDDTDRRWLIAATNAERRKREYYEPLFKLLDDPVALGAIYAELLARDLGGYDGLSAAPETFARARMIDLSRSDEETWLVENMENPPLSRNILTLKDVYESMPANLQKARGLMRSTIPMFLKDRLQGVRYPEQLWIDKNTKVRVWVLRGAYPKLSGEMLAAAYKRELLTDRREAEKASEIAEDFGN